VWRVHCIPTMSKADHGVLRYRRNRPPMTGEFRLTNAGVGPEKMEARRSGGSVLKTQTRGPPDRLGTRTDGLVSDIQTLVESFLHVSAASRIRFRGVSCLQLEHQSRPPRSGRYLSSEPPGCRRHQRPHNGKNSIATAVSGTADGRVARRPGWAFRLRRALSSRRVCED